MFKKSILTAFILVFLVNSYAVFAQKTPDVDKLSDKQIEFFIQEAERRGMSEAQVEAAALANGYSPEAVAKVRERINRLKTGTTSTSQTINEATRQQLGELSERTVLQATSELGEGLKKDSTTTTSVKKLDIFGRSFFNNKKMDFAPNLRIATPKWYVLGPDDELKVDITGYAYQHYDLKISPEGTVKIENLAPIYVNGQTVEEAKKKIVGRLSSLFAGLRNNTLQADVTLGSVRSIQVTLIGEVQTPGTYTLSSLASAFNALYLSGGPNENGSLRNIHVFRNHKLYRTIDIYDFLLKGDLVDNVSLHDQDVIHIPMIDKKVVIDGEVKRPAIYEMKANETYADLLKFSGGYNENAYHEAITVYRNTSKEKQLITLEPKNTTTFLTQNGDKFAVGAILERFENRVEVLGAVFRPGEFAITNGLKTIKQLIAAAEGVREDAFLGRAILIRKNKILDPEFISINLEKLFKGEVEDIALQREDQLVIKSITELREIRNVEIEGFVNSPGKYDYVDNMTVKDLVMIAGGFADGATNKRIEVAKRILSDNATENSVEIISIDIDEMLSGENKLFLNPFDKVFVRKLSNYEEQQIVEIVGEITYPGKYTIKKKEDRISDLIERAGGIKTEGYWEGIRFLREGRLVAVNVAKIKNNPAANENLLLQKGDKLEVPKQKETVTMRGELLNPTEIAFQPKLRFTDYIAQAGGFTDSAYVKKTYVTYANGLTDRTRSFMGMKIYPRVERGMIVYVPVRSRVRMTTAERISLSTGLVSLSAVLLTLIRLL
jgi:polysaccharide biosynthesis/export protein